MPELSGFSGKDIVSILSSMGFVKKRTRGSHVVLRRNHAVCVVPLHDELAPGTLRGVLRQAQLSVEEFLEAAK